jgi:predicted GIY-YIG superfamily endonuclease
VSDFRKTTVYVLRSELDSSKHRVGLTSDLVQRLAGHNAGLNVHTARARPWRLLVSIEFIDEKGACSCRSSS